MFERNLNNKPAPRTGPRKIIKVTKKTEAKDSKLVKFNNTPTAFDPITSDSDFTQTKTTVGIPVYNQYKQDSNKPQVVAYYTNWSQYDRQRDLATVDPKAFDKIILGFFGIAGDESCFNWGQGVCPNAFCGLAQGVYSLNRELDQVSSCDTWADFGNSVNVGITNTYQLPKDIPHHTNLTQATQTAPTTNIPNCSMIGNRGDEEPKFRESNILNSEWDGTRGIFKGLYLLKQKAQQQGHKLELGFSIGGWTLSGVFSELAKVPARRKVFVDSIVDFFDRFPTMFDQVDIDWEYPGVLGEAWNKFDEENDGNNFVLLIAELRQKLDAKFTGDNRKKISIAAIAVPEKLAKSKVKELFDAGLDNINVMTYDFFGTPWAEQLDHHTNLNKVAGFEDRNSIEKAVQYLVDLGIESHRINIGFASYSRSGKGAAIEQYSPLIGTYNRDNSNVLGSYESGVSEWYDILYYFLDLENQSGKNGYVVYTDEHANADYLYSETSKVFMSIDTPRSCFVKGRYAKENNLGSVFMWTGDLEHGTLTNAVRDGAGYELITEKIDMEPFYFCGVNVAPHECELLTFGDQTQPQPLSITIEPTPLVVNEGASINAKAIIDGFPANGFMFEWKIPQGLTANTTTTETVNLTASDVEQDKSYNISVTVTGQGRTGSATASVLVKDVVGIPDPNDKPPIVTLSPSLLEMNEGELKWINSTVSQQNCTYLWTLPSSLTAKDGVTNMSIIQFTANDVNQDTTETVKLVVTNVKGLSTTVTATVKVKDVVSGGEPLQVTIFPNPLIMDENTQLLLAAGIEGMSSTGFTFTWNIPSTLSPSEGTGQTVNVTAGSVTQDVIHPISVTVTGQGRTGTATANLTVRDLVSPTNPLQVTILPKPLIMGENTKMPLVAGVYEISPTDCTFTWDIPVALNPSGTTGRTVDIQASAVTQDTSYPISVTVTGQGRTGSATASVLVKDIVSSTAPSFTIEPQTRTVTQGALAQFLVGEPKGDMPFTCLWAIPPELSAFGNDVDNMAVVYDTTNALAKDYIVAVTVTDKNGLSTTKTANLTVNAANPTPGECTDPDAVGLTPWDSSVAYGNLGTKVNYKDLIWTNSYYINPNEAAPNIHAGWKLVSNVVLDWNNTSTYQAYAYVNHNDSQWKAEYYAGPGIEPGSSAGIMWIKNGPRSCAAQVKKLII